MNLGFDLDGVLYPWHSSVYRYFVEFKNYKDSYSEFWTNYWHIPSVQEDVVYLTTVPLFCEDANPIEGGLQLLNYLDSLGHTLHYITNRPEEVVYATQHYLQKQKFPQYENLYIGKDKPIYARSVNLNLFVDDREKNIIDMTPVCLSLLMAQPWNKDYQDKYPTIYNISEVLKFVKG